MSALAMIMNCTAVLSVAQDILNLAVRRALFADIANIVNGAVSPGDAIDNYLAIE